MTFRREALLTEELRDEHDTPLRDSVRKIAAGSEVECPGCGNDSNVSGYDLEWVGWHCELRESGRACSDSRASNSEGRQAEHAACGMRVLLEVSTSATDAGDIPSSAEQP